MTAQTTKEEDGVLLNSICLQLIVRVQVCGSIIEGVAGVNICSSTPC